MKAFIFLAWRAFPTRHESNGDVALSAVVAASRGHRIGMREIMSEICLCVERACYNGAFGDLEAILSSSDHPVSPVASIGQ